MSWMSQLYATYEKNVGREETTDTAMTPVAHMNANAQLEVTLNMEGNFLGAVAVNKEHAVTLIPVTEASAGRSSGVAPHALCDTLSYIAGDFEIYNRTKGKRNGPAERFESYISNLQKWAESEFTHPKVYAIYQYLSKRRLMSDLIQSGIVEIDSDGMLLDKKIAGQAYEKALVRFRVAPSGYLIENTVTGLEDKHKLCQRIPDGTWADSSLIKAYTSYYLENQKGNTDICYFIGEERTISENHPKGIIAANYGAKLVSANDNQGFTYKGRFQNAEQAYSLSYEASQKIHSALTWLAKTQGVYVGTKDKRMFLCWSPKNKKIPDIFAELGLVPDEEYAWEPVSYKRKLIRTFQGYRQQFDKSDTIIVMALDAATTGRLSVTYYNESPALDFLDRIEYWGESCNWFFLKFNEKGQPYYEIRTPLLRRIVECAYGREQGSYIEADDRILKEQVQRLLKCMVEGQQIPFDLVQALTIRASTPMAYSRSNRERVLSTACAMVSKYHNRETKGEREDMKLDENNRDRSYLFGRLLAICEKVERSTYDRGDTRDPNAIRLQSAFVNHPMQTWKILEGLLNPYFQKLVPGLREYYRRLISEVVELLPQEDPQILNQGLGETYLLGYYLQRAELNKKKDSQKEEKKNE